MHPVSRFGVAMFGTGLALYVVAVHSHDPGGAFMTFLTVPELWVAVGFAAVIGIVLWQRVPRMVGTMLDARAAAIRAELDEARRLREEAHALLQSYRARAAAAEKEAESIVAEAKAEAERFAVEARAHLRTQIERRTKLAQDKIGQAEAQAMSEIRAAAADIATAAAARLLAARIDEKRSSDLIAQSLKDLPDKLN